MRNDNSILCYFCRWVKRNTEVRLQDILHSDSSTLDISHFGCFIFWTFYSYSYIENRNFQNVKCPKLKCPIVKCLGVLENGSWWLVKSHSKVSS